MKSRVAALVALAISLSRARAEPERPWAAGVSQADQTRSYELFAQANELVEQGLFTAAVDVYGQALSRWDHPAIRYNLAVALINLERQIDAYQELARSLRYGADALEPEVYRQALVYQRLLHAQIVELTVACTEPGAQVALDNKPLALSCPGTTTALVLPGRHELVASKPGYLLRSVELTPAGGETPRVELALKTIEAATVFRRRWPRWKPWVVVGAGAAVVLGGVGLELQAAATFRSYDRAVATLCPDHPCASLPGLITDAYAEGRRDNRWAIGLFATGGAAIATGAVLLWLDRAVAEQIGYAPRFTARIGAREAVFGAQLAF